MTRYQTRLQACQTMMKTGGEWPYAMELAGLLNTPDSWCLALTDREREAYTRGLIDRGILRTLDALDAARKETQP